MNLHRSIIDFPDRIEESLFTWLWEKHQEKLSKQESYITVTSDEILVAVKYPFLKKSLRKKFIRAWKAMEESGVILVERSVSFRPKHWIVAPFYDLMIQPK